MFKHRGIKLSINTNGSTHNPEWWAELGEILGVEDKVIFSLDGLKEDHERYRCGISFDKTIENMKSFNDVGGISYCNTVLFRHNENYLMEIKKIANDIGCKVHREKISWWYDEEFQRPISVDVNTRTETSKMNNFITCEHLDYYGNISYSLNPDGEYFPCCFILQAIEKGNDDILIKLYEESKDQLKDLKTAIDSPLFSMVSFYDICKKKCRGFTCQTAYEIDHKSQSKRNTMECFYDDGKPYDISLKDISIIRKKYPLFNFEKYRNIWDDLYPDVVRCISKWDNIDAFSYSQYLGKKYIIHELEKYDFKNVMIIGSWVGILSRMIFDKFTCAITTVDKDPLMNEPTEFLNRNYKLHLHLPFDIKSIDTHNSDVVINTSCEHMDDEWFHKTVSGQLLILQSTDRVEPDHINTVKSLEDMKIKYPMTVLFEKEISVWNDQKNKRYMLIGKK
jgi:hypothetical protein